jgi:ribosomal-protein-alanine N-acetyltransferase
MTIPTGGRLYCEGRGRFMLHTERLILEPLEPGHAADLFVGLCDARLYGFIDGGPPESVDSLRERYRQLAERRSPDGQEIWLNWAIRTVTEGRYLGFVQSTVECERNATIAYLLFHNAWGNGYGREAVSAMLTHIVEQYSVATIRAHVHPANLPSIALLNALGFQRVVTPINVGRNAAADPSEVEFLLSTENRTLGSKPLA